MGRGMEYYRPIADDIAANGDVDGAAAFARMSQEVDTQVKDIPTADIKRYLILMDKWLPIKKAAADPIQYKESADITIDALSMFDAFGLTDPVNGPLIANKLGAMMDALIADNLIDAADKAAILGIGTESAVKWPGLEQDHCIDAMRMRSEGKL